MPGTIHSLATFLLLVLIGCGGPKTVAEKKQAAKKDPVVQTLQKTGLAYIQHIDAKRKGPANWEDFLSYAKLANLDLDAIELIKAKGYRVNWGVSYSSATGGVSTFVLVQPSGRRPRLMLDGTVQIN